MCEGRLTGRKGLTAYGAKTLFTGDGHFEKVSLDLRCGLML